MHCSSLRITDVAPSVFSVSQNSDGLKVSNKLKWYSCNHAAVATTVIWDHGNVHFVNDAEDWQIEVNKAKATGKVVSR
jgi:hypothetical protein